MDETRTTEILGEEGVLRVVVDDIRTHPGGGVHLRSSAEARAWLDEHPGLIDELWLDHDLGGDDDVRGLVRYLEERCYLGTPLLISRIYVHTDNPAGAKWILSSNLLSENYHLIRMRMPKSEGVLP
jgi:hypothetical protein